MKLLDKDPKKRLGSRFGSLEIKKHAFFGKIDWDKMLNKQYIPPEPYLKLRFENFLKLPLDQKTNQDVYQDFRKDLFNKVGKDSSGSQVHINGWSFALMTENQQQQSIFQTKTPLINNT